MQFDTGIAPIGHVDSGSHFCHFYRTAEDLGETLVPYFKTGLEANEACIWVTAPPYQKERALAELNTHVADLQRRLDAGQLKVYGHDEWYALHGAKSRTDVARAWLEAKDAGLAAGYRALRLTGNTAFLQHADWEGFMEYESILRDAFHRQELLALCSYNTSTCDADSVLDVVQAHDFALSRRRGVWEIVESATVKQHKAELVALNTRLEHLVDERTRDLTAALGHQRMLTAELSHRVKNTLASVQTIVEQTMRRVPGSEDARAALRGRLSALARVHEKLARTEWAGVNLGEVLAPIAAAYGNRISLHLDDRRLTPRATLDFGLVFHELATNAAKYGALSTDRGSVHVTASCAGASGLFEIVWSETGGPAATAPASESFGLRLIRQLVAHDLRGETELRFEPTGLTCIIRAPGSEVLGQQAGCAHGHVH